MSSSLEHSGGAAENKGFNPEILGDFETGTKGQGSVESGSLYDETAETARHEREKKTLVDGLEKSGLTTLKESIEGFTATQVFDLDQALNSMASAGNERLLWVPESEESQVEAARLIQVILLGQEDATKRKAAESLYNLTS